MQRPNSLTLGADRALYLGELPPTGWHAHPAPVLLVGLSGRFRLDLRHGRTETCSSALVGAGVEHVFDPCGEQVALLYLEPDAPEARGLRDVLRQQGGVLFDPAAPVVARGTAETRLRGFDLGQLLRVRPAEAPPPDARVAACLALLRGFPARPVRRETAARQAMLSSSRFNHLFREEMGVSFRSYRTWSQLRLAMLGLGPRADLTQAALDGGFADSAHFSRAFRGAFAMTPSSVLKPVAQVTRL